MYGQDLTMKTCSIITIYRAAMAVISSLYMYRNKVQGSILRCFGLFCLVYVSLNKGISDCRLFFCKLGYVKSFIREASILSLNFIVLKVFPFACCP